jgi:murein DD-endopeptidase MepM/ murein hydrolase activator NlpD
VNKRYFPIAAGALLLVSVGMIFFLSRSSKKETKDRHTSDEQVTEEAAIQYRFGIPIDSFKIQEYKIQANQNLSEILLSRGISYGQIDELAKKSKPIFDVRKMKAGRPCTFFFAKDSLNSLKYMVYEKDLEDYIVYEFGDSILVNEGKKEVLIEERFVEGEIESSLWNALEDLNVSTKLAVELSAIYAWTIDFFGIQKGDAFSIVYTVKLIDGEAIGLDEIKASSFLHGGKTHYAFQFEQDGRLTYFNEKGESLRRAFLKAPFEYMPRISSGYTKSRLHPILRVYRPHQGIDYAAPQGTPVLAIGDGKVVKIAYDKASGNYIKIKHNSVYTSGYMHLRERPKGLNVGDYVNQKQVIGRVGKTGYATGPHLDFRIWKNGELVNPLKIESPPVEPIAEENRVRFDSVIQVYQRQLSGNLVIPDLP